MLITARIFCLLYSQPEWHWKDKIWRSFGRSKTAKCDFKYWQSHSSNHRGYVAKSPEQIVHCLLAEEPHCQRIHSCFGCTICHIITVKLPSPKIKKTSVPLKEMFDLQYSGHRGTFICTETYLLQFWYHLTTVPTPHPNDQGTLNISHDLINHLAELQYPESWIWMPYRVETVSLNDTTVN